MLNDAYMQICMELKIIHLQSGQPRSADSSDDDMGTEEEQDVDVVSKKSLSYPSMYKILMLNDDFTAMDFVVHVLERFFSFNRSRAVELMLTVHNEGAATVGIFTYEIAETRVSQVMEYAQKRQQPLQCVLEKAQ
jgi:ATP-dependent Clp protease adaptor protein ClpS